ncbi:MAG: hypothetical protein D6689_17265 [Deltaproteobacteria bacterium]|nr:MAG: hypothetical protein D6689_17265 [Deltaproteobacteria bacterium]
MARKLVPRAERATVNHEFRSIDEFITEYVMNLSRSGVFIRSKDPLPVGTKVDLKFTVILDDPETIEGVGEVVRVSDDPKGMGVVFTELTDVSRTLIERVLTRRTAAAPTRARTVPPPPPKPRKE